VEHPTKLETLKNIKEISISEGHAIVIDSKGDAYSWGSGKYGELGLEKIIFSPFPTKIHRESDRPYLKVWCSDLITCFLDINLKFSYFGVIIKIFKGSSSSITLKSLLNDQSNSDPNYLFQERIIYELENETFSTISIGNGFIGLLSDKGLVYTLDQSDNITILYSKFVVYSISVSNNQLYGLCRDNKVKNNSNSNCVNSFGNVSPINKYNLNVKDLKEENSNCNNNSRSYYDNSPIVVLKNDSNLNINTLSTEYYLCRWIASFSERDVISDSWTTHLYKINSDLEIENMTLIDSKNKDILLILYSDMTHETPGNISSTSLLSPKNRVSCYNLDCDKDSIIDKDNNRYFEDTILDNTVNYNYNISALRKNNLDKSEILQFVSSFDDSYNMKYKRTKNFLGARPLNLNITNKKKIMKSGNDHSSLNKQDSEVYELEQNLNPSLEKNLSEIRRKLDKNNFIEKNHANSIEKTRTSIRRMPNQNMDDSVSVSTRSDNKYKKSHSNSNRYKAARSFNSYNSMMSKKEVENTEKNIQPISNINSNFNYTNIGNNYYSNNANNTINNEEPMFNNLEIHPTESDLSQHYPRSPDAESIVQFYVDSAGFANLNREIKQIKETIEMDEGSINEANKFSSNNTPSVLSPTSQIETQRKLKVDQFFPEDDLHVNDGVNYSKPKSIAVNKVLDSINVNLQSSNQISTINYVDNEVNTFPQTKINSMNSSLLNNTVIVHNTVSESNYLNQSSNINLFKSSSPVFSPKNPVAASGINFNLHFIDSGIHNQSDRKDTSVQGDSPLSTYRRKKVLESSLYKGETSGAEQIFKRPDLIDEINQINSGNRSPNENSHNLIANISSQNKSNDLIEKNSKIKYDPINSKNIINSLKNHSLSQLEFSNNNLVEETDSPVPAFYHPKQNKVNYNCNIKTSYQTFKPNYSDLEENTGTYISSISKINYNEIMASGINENINESLQHDEILSKEENLKFGDKIDKNPDLKVESNLSKNDKDSPYITSNFKLYDINESKTHFEEIYRISPSKEKNLPLQFFTKILYRLIFVFYKETRKEVMGEIFSKILGYSIINRRSVLMKKLILKKKVKIFEKYFLKWKKQTNYNKSVELIHSIYIKHLNYVFYFFKHYSKIYSLKKKYFKEFIINLEAIILKKNKIHFINRLKVKDYFRDPSIFNQIENSLNRLLEIISNHLKKNGIKTFKQFYIRQKLMMKNIEYFTNIIKQISKKYKDQFMKALILDINHKEILRSLVMKKHTKRIYFLKKVFRTIKKFSMRENENLYINFKLKKVFKIYYYKLRLKLIKYLYKWNINATKKEKPKVILDLKINDIRSKISSNIPRKIPGFSSRSSQKADKFFKLLKSHVDKVLSKTKHKFMQNIYTFYIDWKILGMCKGFIFLNLKNNFEFFKEKLKNIVITQRAGGSLTKIGDLTSYAFTDCFLKKVDSPEVEKKESSLYTCEVNEAGLLVPKIEFKNISNINLPLATSFHNILNTPKFKTYRSGNFNESSSLKNENKEGGVFSKDTPCNQKLLFKNEAYDLKEKFADIYNPSISKLCNELNINSNITKKDLGLNLNFKHEFSPKKVADVDNNSNLIVKILTESLDKERGSAPNPSRIEDICCDQQLLNHNNLNSLNNSLTHNNSIATAINLNNASMQVIQNDQKSSVSSNQPSDNKRDKFMKFIDSEPRPKNNSKKLIITSSPIKKSSCCSFYSEIKFPEATDLEEKKSDLNFNNLELVPYTNKTKENYKKYRRAKSKSQTNAGNNNLLKKFLYSERLDDVKINFTEKNFYSNPNPDEDKESSYVNFNYSSLLSPRLSEGYLDQFYNIRKPLRLISVKIPAKKVIPQRNIERGRKNISENISNKKILNKTFNEINKINISEKKINKNTTNLANLSHITQVNGQNRGSIGSSKKKTNIKNYISHHSQINKSSFVENANLSKTNNTRNKNVVQKIDELQKKEEQFIQENSYLTKNQESSYGMRILHKLIKRRKVFYKLVFLHRGKFNS
jgi:hypothetical protein